MAEVREFRDSWCRQKQDGEIQAAPPVRFCAYNLSGKRFISNDVTLAVASSREIKECLENLGPESASAVWIFPIRRLLPADFRVPADLLYLDEESAVLGIVQSFPIGRSTVQYPEASSILVLPAQSAVMAGIEPGNRVLISSPDEMHAFLLNPQPQLTEVSVGPQLVVPQAPSKDEPQPDSKDLAAEVWEWAEQLEAAETAEPGAPQAVMQQESANSAAPNSVASYVSPKKTFWQKLLRKKSTDPRRATRTALPGLVAYFFTGGVPFPHPVKNISGSGLYVLTAERWYHGTVVRLTLTDERWRRAERSITVHAKVIRSMDDGVALQFVLQEPLERAGQVSISRIDPIAGCSSREQVEAFIQSFVPAVLAN